MVGWILMKTDSSANLRLGLALGRIKDPTCCAKDMLRWVGRAQTSESDSGERSQPVLVQCPQGSQRVEII